jgi:hypothetical protein
LLSGVLHASFDAAGRLDEASGGWQFLLALAIGVADARSFAP